MKFTCNLMHSDLTFYTIFIPIIWFQENKNRINVTALHYENFHPTRTHPSQQQG